MSMDAATLQLWQMRRKALNDRGTCDNNRLHSDNMTHNHINKYLLSPTDTIIYRFININAAQY